MPLSLRKVFSQAIVVQILNPKIALFFLSFLPQFIDPSANSVALQTVFLGASLVALGFLTDSSYTILAARLRDRFLRYANDSRSGEWFSGLTYIELGFYTALSGSSAKRAS